MISIPYLSLLFITLLSQIYSSILNHSIKYTYNKIFQEPLTYASKLNEISISSDNIIFHSPLCEQSEETETKNIYRDCTVYSIFNLTITVTPNYTFFLQNFYIEYYYSGITFELDGKLIKPTITMELSPQMKKSYLFNVFRPPLASNNFKDLTSLLHSAGQNLRELYKDILINRFRTETENNVLETDLSSAFILLYLDSIVIETKDPIVTYYSFLLTQTDKVINLFETTIIGTMMVQFEYSIEYNLTYQEGSFTLYDFDFEKNMISKDDPFKGCEFDDFKPENEVIQVKDFIFDRFKYWLILSISKNYYIKISNDGEWSRQNT